MTEVFNNTVTQTMHETSTATMTDVVNNVSAFILHEAGLRHCRDVPMWCMYGMRTLCGRPLIARWSAYGKFPAIFVDGPAWTCSCQISSDVHGGVVADFGLPLCLDHLRDRHQDHVGDRHPNHDRYHQQHGHGYGYSYREAHRFVDLFSCPFNDTDHIRNSYHDRLRDCGMLFSTLFPLDLITDFCCVALKDHHVCGRKLTGLVSLNFQILICRML